MILSPRALLRVRVLVLGSTAPATYRRDRRSCLYSYEYGLWYEYEYGYQLVLVRVYSYLPQASHRSRHYCSRARIPMPWRYSYYA
eukprot:scaffold34897_cov50-Prasinocladus_malaysianus.AAC.1